MVSWNDAADDHDSVANDALVIPISPNCVRHRSDRSGHRMRNAKLGALSGKRIVVQDLSAVETARQAKETTSRI